MTIVNGQQQQPDDYSQMFMVCSPVYSRNELQKIMETSINSLAFQIPVNPLQKSKINSLNKLNNINNLNVQNDLHNPPNNVQSNNDRSIQNSSQINDIKHATNKKDRMQEAPPTTTYLPNLSTLFESTTIQPITSSISTEPTSPSTSTTTTSPSTTILSSTTTSTPITTISSSTIAKSRAHHSNKSSSYKRYHKHSSYVPHNRVIASTAATTTTTELPLSIELNTKPSLAKIRSRLFNLFPPRQFNSNSHKTRGPVDYPTLTPQSLFNNLNNLNSNLFNQQPTTTSPTAKSLIDNNKLIYTSTESYPQIRSSILPENQLANSERQSNLQTTTASSPVDNFNDDKTKIQSSNDNLLAVASSSRFQSVINSNEEKVLNKLDKLKKEETKLNGNAKGVINKNENQPIETTTANSINIGPLNIEEIFSEIGESNDTNNNNEDKNKQELIKMNKNATKLTTEQSLIINNEEANLTESSIIDEANDGLIVKKLSDVIENLSDDETNDKNDRSSIDSLIENKYLPKIIFSTDLDDKLSDDRPIDAKGEIKEDKKSTLNRQNDFKEIPTGSAIDRFTEINAKSSSEKLIDDKVIDKLTEVIDRLVEEKAIEDKSSVTIVNDHFETTTVSNKDESSSKLNSYTYPIEYMIKDAY